MRKTSLCFKSICCAKNEHFWDKKTSCLCSSSFNQLLLSFLIYFLFFLWMFVFLFSNSKNVFFFFFFGLKLFRGVKTGAEKKREKKWRLRKLKFTNTPHTAFVQQYSIDDILWTHPFSDLNSPYIETVCANAGSQTRCCTTLYVARCFIVLSCAVCNKDKVSATLWRLKWIIEVWRCDVCLLTILNH